MWSTEAHYNVADGSDWAPFMNAMYIDKNLTGFQSWALLSAYDSFLAFPDHGLFRAWWPTSGHYELIGRMWVTAHTTQFSSADGDWVYLANRTGAGYLSQGGSYVSLRNVKTGDWSLVVEKQAGDNQNTQPETATFQLDAALAGAAPQLAVWRSRIDSSVTDNDTSAYFVQEAPLVLGPGVTSFTLDIAVGDVITVTTLTTGRKGAHGSVPPATPFPTSYSDDFSACLVGQEANFFVSQNGMFQCATSNDGSGATVMRQVTATWPIQWRPDEQRPHTVGGSATWADTSASVAFRLNASSDIAMFAVRCFVDDTLGAAGPISSEMWMRGAWLRVDGAGSGGASSWGLYPSYANATNSYAKVTGGATNAPIAAGAWHTATLAVKGGVASASLDGAQLFSGVDARFAPPTGYVGFGTGDYGQFVEYKDLTVQAAN